MIVVVKVVAEDDIRMQYWCAQHHLTQPNMSSRAKPAIAFQSIRPAKIRFYLRSMREMGFDSWQVLRGTEVDETSLEDPFTFIQIPDYIRLVSNMMELSGDPTLAFTMRKHLKSGDLGVLGSAFSSSTNYEEGVDVWIRYNRLFLGDLISTQKFRQSGMQYYELAPLVPLLPHLLRFFVEEKIALDSAVMEKLNTQPPGIEFFSVTYPRPAHGNLYDEILAVEVEFNAERILLGIDYRDPNFCRRFESANRELQQVCVAHLNKISSIASSRATLSPQVKQLLLESLPEIPTLLSLAESFSSGKRTFCRNLEIEHTNYKCLLAEVREELAKNYLVTTSLSTDQIALQLGFQDTGSLRKAFKRWTGSTMKRYREQYRGVV